ncbi:hypothetical protein GF407_20290 [candidate division KSB1 bacterium]|nr:hypothetical protein [candidate division KSB1 bacterium]
MNYVWLFLVLVAVIIGAISGQIKEVTEAAFDTASSAVEIALSLIGIMTLWLGIMKIAEDAGLIKLLARAIRPVSNFLFPSIPKDHPAIGAIVLNLSANWLGLGNAATPMGIKAMEHLQTLNEKKDTATDAMIMFLALNTASITLIPMTIIAVRTGLGSGQPTAIIGTTIFSSVTATITAITVVKLIQAFSRKRQPAGIAEDEKRDYSFLLRAGIYAAIFALLLFVLIRLNVFQFIATYFPGAFFRQAINAVSIWAIPVLLFLIPLIGIIKKVKIYEVFVDGAKEGFQVAVRIIPFLVAILVAIGMFRASGAMELFVMLVSPLTELIGMPAEILPAAIMRPLSGSGALGIITELLKTHGPDSFIGNLASTLYGCTETTFYVIAVYFGAVQVKNIRYAIPAGLIADLAGVLAALFICRQIFL